MTAHTRNHHRRTSVFVPFVLAILVTVLAATSAAAATDTNPGDDHAATSPSSSISSTSPGQLAAATAVADPSPSTSQGSGVPRIRPFGTVVAEGDTGSQVANAVVYLEDAVGDPYVATEPITVDWSTGDTPHPNIAHPGQDFLAASGTLAFEPGQSQATVPITVLGDTVDEPPFVYGEWLLIAFSNPSSNAVLDTSFFGLGIVIILDESTDRRGSGGCFGTSTPITEMRTITTADGLDREYRIHVPASYDSRQPMPVVLNLPGTHDSVQRQLESTRAEDLADTENFIAVVPVGYEESTHTVDFEDREPGEEHYTWNTGANPDLVDDFAFIDQLLDQLEGDTCIDLDQVFTMGMSGGAAMAVRVGCVMPDRIAAVAAVAAFPAPCTGPPPAVVFQGDADDIVPFVLIESRVSQWAAAAGCSAVPDLTAISVDFEIELRSFTGCDDNGALEFYVIEDGGHRWPGDTSDLPQVWQDLLMPPVCLINELYPCLGTTTLDLDATAEAWAFFQNHPLT